MAKYELSPRSKQDCKDIVEAIEVGNLSHAAWIWLEMEIRENRKLVCIWNSDDENTIYNRDDLAEQISSLEVTYHQAFRSYVTGTIEHLKSESETGYFQ